MGFSIKSTLRFAWETFKKRPWIFVGATLLLSVAQIVVEGLAQGFDSLSADLATAPLTAVALIGLVVYYGLSTLISMGMTAFFLAAHDDPGTVELSALWHPHPFWKYLGVTVLFVLAILAALLLFVLFNVAMGLTEPGFGSIAILLLLIVLGTIFWLTFMFAGFFVIDREVNPIEAFKESYRITSGHKWRLFGLSLVLLLINFLGLLALLVGVLLSAPVSLLALTHAYRVLSGTAGTPPEPAADAKLAA